MAILRRTGAVASLIACSAGLQACELREPLATTLTKDQAAVMSVLTAGDSIARVLLTIVPAAYEPFNPSGESNWIPIAGAHVQIVEGTDTITLAAQTGAESNACLPDPPYQTSPARWLLPGCYVGRVPGGVQAGATYGLLADLPGWGRVEGRTTVPAEPAIISPEAGAEINALTPGSATAAPVNVQWSSVSARSILDLRVRSTDDACSVTLSPAYSRLTLPASDSSSVEILVQMSCAAGVSSVPGSIILTAFDSTYSHYLAVTSGNHQRADASAGFTGPAVGVFGSAATVRQPVRFVK